MNHVLDIMGTGSE